MRNVRETMAVADETVIREEIDQGLEDLRIAKGKLVYWILGILFSLLPLLALPFSGLLKNGDVMEALYKLFCDASILFVSISFTITTLNDFIAECVKQNKYGWAGLTLFLLFLGMIIYTTLLFTQEKDTSVVFKINLLYSITMFFLSLSKYINQIRGIKNGIS